MIFVDNEIVTKQKMFTLLGVPENSIPRSREKRFRFNTRVDSDGNKRHLKTLLCNEYSVYVPSINRDVRVRWANQQKKDKEGNFEYFPSDNTLESGEAGEARINDEMVFLFWYVCPFNRQSPFRKAGGMTYYEFLDNDHLAKTANEIEETRIMALSLIFGLNSWPISRLKMLAKGMGIAGVDDMTNDVVKTILRERAYKDPSLFLNQAESREVQFSGKIQEAIDRHIITLSSVNGMQRWYLGSKEIIPVQYGIDARTILDDHLSAKWYMYSDEINNLLEGTTVASNLAQAENDDHFSGAEPIETMSEVDAVLWNEYLDLKKDKFKFEKIEKYADVDINNAGIHPNKRKVAVELAEEIALYKKMQGFDK